MKKSIFQKILLIMIAVGIVPMAFFYLLVVGSYQELINQYTPYLQDHPELLSKAHLNYKNINIQVVLILVLAAIFVIFFSVLLARKIYYPIRKLIRGTTLLKQGKLGTRVHLKTSDEFEELADSFNKMAEEIEDDRLRMKEANTVLEIKVRARTRELQELNDILKEKVKEKTQELQKKLQELERFNKLAVGREIKMIQLKNDLIKAEDRIKQLEKTLKKK